MHARRKHSLAIPLVLVALAALGAGCGGGDDNTAPQTGAIQVKTATGGSNLDDSYTVAVDGGQGKALGGNDSTVFDDLSTARHSVKLSDRADNCTTQGGDSTGIDVLAGDTVLFTFTVNCTGPAGTPTVVTSPATNVAATTATLQGTVNPNGQDASVTFEIGSTPTLGAQCNPATVSGTEVQSLTCPVSGLTPATTYYYRITATNAAGRADGEILTFTTTAAAGLSGRIAFESSRDDGNGEIYIADADGSGSVTRLTTDPGQDQLPRLSPDGTRIAWSSNRSGNFDIYVMNLDGSGIINVTNSPEPESFATWSPDGTKLAFDRTANANRDIYVQSADGSGSATRLTDDPGEDTAPAWSPDGAKIAFATDRDDGFLQDEIYVMNPDGSGQTRLTNRAGFTFDPVWSPDNRIAFSGDPGASNFGNEIYVINADGSNEVRLTTDDFYDGRPAWSPDGGHLAFQRTGGALIEVFVMDAAGSNQTNFSNNPAFDGSPSWGP